MSDWIQQESPLTRQRHIDEIAQDIKNTADNLYLEIVKEDQQEQPDYPEEQEEQLSAEPFSSDHSAIKSEEPQEDFQEELHTPEIISQNQEEDFYSDDVADPPLSEHEEPEEPPKVAESIEISHIVPERATKQVETIPIPEPIKPTVHRPSKGVEVRTQGLANLHARVDEILKESPTKAKKLSLQGSTVSRGFSLTPVTVFSPAVSGENFMSSHKTSPPKNMANADSERLKSSPPKDAVLTQGQPTLVHNRYTSNTSTNASDKKAKKEYYDKSKLDRIMVNIIKSQTTSPNPQKAPLSGVSPPLSGGNQYDESRKVYYSNNNSVATNSSPVRFGANHDYSHHVHTEDLSQIGRDFLQLRLDTNSSKSKEINTPTPLKVGPGTTLRCSCGQSLVYRESVGDDGQLRECLDAMECSEDSGNRESLAQRRNLLEKKTKVAVPQKVTEEDFDEADSREEAQRRYREMDTRQQVERKTEKYSNDGYVYIQDQISAGYKGENRAVSGAGERKRGVTKPQEMLKVMRKTERVLM